MITFEDSHFNLISQKEYDSFLTVVLADILNSPCEHCGECGHLIKWGTYTKFIAIIDETDPAHIESLHIQRIFCKHCHRTFSVFPVLLLPYIRFHLKDIYRILADFFSKRNVIETLTDLITQRTIRRYAKRFEKWNQQFHIDILSFSCRQFLDFYSLKQRPLFCVSPPT